MSEGFTIANFRHVAKGLQPGQFSVAERKRALGLADLDPKYKQLLDQPVTMTLGLIGPDGRVSLTPMWFDYEGDKVLVNTASHRNKCEWIRSSPRLTMLLVNPRNPYHWVQIKCTVEKEMGSGMRTASTLPGSSIGFGQSTQVDPHLMPYGILRSMRNGCCSSAASIVSLLSANPDQN